MFPSVNSGADSCQQFLVESPLGGKLKRLIDVVFVMLALVVWVPVCIIIALVVRITSLGPIFYYHERIGFQGRRFSCIKFRTMVVDADARLREHLAACPDARDEFRTLRKLRNDPRIVPVVGHFLRKTSFDELPQLINVLRGEMSIVGPRPVTEEELKLYGSSKKAYYSVRPGITGLWQVSGRNSLTFSERVAIDTRYVQNWSFGLDLSIVARTCGVLLTGNGAC